MKTGMSFLDGMYPRPGFNKSHASVQEKVVAFLQSEVRNCPNTPCLERCQRDTLQALKSQKNGDDLAHLMSYDPVMREEAFLKYLRCFKSYGHEGLLCSRCREPPSQRNIRLWKWDEACGSDGFTHVESYSQD